MMKNRFRNSSKEQTERIIQRNWISFLIWSLAFWPLAAAAAQLTRTNLLEYKSDNGEVKRVEKIADWEKRRRSILESMEVVMGPFPGVEKQCPLMPKIESETDCGEYIRQALTYASEPGSRVPAYLLIPKAVANGGTSAYGILCLHQTHSAGNKVVVGLGNSPNDEYGVELARRGFVCLAPAYPLLAEYQPDLETLGYQSGTMKAIWDNHRGLDLLEQLSYVHKGEFGAIGHSLGGHNAIYSAVFDNRIKVIVSSCGFDAYRHYMKGDIRGWTSSRYMPKLGAYLPTERPFDFDELLGALAPREIFVSAPLHDSNFLWWSVDEVANSARPVFELFGKASNLRVEHPTVAHTFPKEMRELAYSLLEKHLHRK